jgi:hypothetical protein
VVLPLSQVHALEILAAERIIAASHAISISMFHFPGFVLVADEKLFSFETRSTRNKSHCYWSTLLHSLDILLGYCAYLFYLCFTSTHLTEKSTLVRENSTYACSPLNSARDTAYVVEVSVIVTRLHRN